MKLFKLALLSFIFLPVATFAAPKHTDKAAHFGLAYAGQMTCAVVTNKILKNKLASNLGCAALVSAAGVAKELTDPGRGGNKEFGDIVANSAGIAAAGITFEWGF